MISWMIYDFVNDWGLLGFFLGVFGVLFVYTFLIFNDASPLRGFFLFTLPLRGPGAFLGV